MNRVSIYCACEWAGDAMSEARTTCNTVVGEQAGSAGELCHWCRTGTHSTHPRMFTDSTRAFHERTAQMDRDGEDGIGLLDARYHDHLPPDTNCHLCGVEHAAIHPELLRSNR